MNFAAAKLLLTFSFEPTKWTLQRQSCLTFSFASTKWTLQQQNSLSLLPVQICHTFCSRCAKASSPLFRSCEFLSLQNRRRNFITERSMLPLQNSLSFFAGAKIKLLLQRICSCKRALRNDNILQLQLSNCVSDQQWQSRPAMDCCPHRVKVLSDLPHYVLWTRTDFFMCPSFAVSSVFSFIGPHKRILY